MSSELSSEAPRRGRGGAASFRSSLFCEYQQLTIMRSFLVLLGIVILTAPFGRVQAQVPSQDSLESHSRPEYRLLRQEEDWSAWAGKETGFASLKYVSLTEDAVLTIGGEVRSYGRWYQNEQWGAGPDRDGYLLQRFMLHSSVQSGSEEVRVRAFTQLKSGLVRGRDGPIYPPDRDRLGVNQAFLEVGARVGEGTLTLRTGRQELHYGAGRMIAVREGPNVRLGFDAVLARYEFGAWRTDLFAAKPNNTASGILDNGWMPGRTLWGLHLGRQEKSGGQSVYYVGTRRRPSPVGNNLQATRHTVGGRRHGAVGGLRYDLEGAIQLGRYRRQSAATEEIETGPIRAWTLAGRVSYRADRLLAKPTVGLLVDWSSGDVAETEAQETFAAPYPSGRFSGAGSRLGPSNLINAAPILTLHFPAEVRLQLKSHLFWRSTTTDGIYAIWGVPLRDGSGTSAQFVGAMPEAVLSWKMRRHLNVALEASEFRAGPVLRQGSVGRDMMHLGLRISYVF